MVKSILIVDDEQNLRDVTRAYLEKVNYQVFEAVDGLEALKIFDTEEIHLVILDVMMPKMNGIEFLEIIREYSDVPVIMLTAKVEETDLIKGIKLGADDYIKKPFSMRELMIRIEALVRRAYGRIESKVYTFREGNLVIDFGKMRVTKNGKSIEMTPNEFKIIKVFVENCELVLSRDQLIEKAFGLNFSGYDRTIDTHIKNLRQKIEDNAKTPTYIRTIYGMGYQFMKGDLS